jgi:hypothetical protein
MTALRRLRRIRPSIEDPNYITSKIYNDTGLVFKSVLHRDLWDALMYHKYLGHIQSVMTRVCFNISPDSRQIIDYMVVANGCYFINCRVYDSPKQQETRERIHSECGTPVHIIKCKDDIRKMLKIIRTPK